MTDKFTQLAKLGAGDFEHLNGSLMTHLKGTQQLLAKWGANDLLQTAGLYHAAYGTAGFDEQLVASNQRSKIADIIGNEAESIVYEYCACDRTAFFPQFGGNVELTFPNRFTEESYSLSTQMLEYFCELTAANEIEIALHSTDFIAQHGAGLYDLFKRMAPYLSNSAQQEAERVLG